MTPPQLPSSSARNLQSSGLNNESDSPDTSMPRKRFMNQYSKPASTAHSSLSSAASGPSTSASQHGATSVNDMLSRLRIESNKPTPSNPAAQITVAHTLPPNVRNLLAQPETPVPYSRGRGGRRVDASGRRLPPGPAPPSSWLKDSIWAPESAKGDVRIWPEDITALPGLGQETLSGNALQHTCMRAIARHWTYIQDNEKYIAAYLRTTQRMALLSNIAIYGPLGGITMQGLMTLLVPPSSDNDDRELLPEPVDNSDFFRLDLSGAIGKFLRVKDLQKLFRSRKASLDAKKLSWEEFDNIQNPESPSLILPKLTHLSLSHPHTRYALWPSLMDLSTDLATLTHLSLAYWPAPTATPNSSSTITSVIHNSGPAILYSTTNIYSHSLDFDFTEAADILRRLASRLYSLEYLDLTGCSKWWMALRSTATSVEDDAVVDWGTQWPRLRTIILKSGIRLTEDSEFYEVSNYCSAYQQALLTQLWLRERMRVNRGLERPSTQVEIIIDDIEYPGLFWFDTSDETNEDVNERGRKRKLINDSLIFRQQFLDRRHDSIRKSQQAEHERHILNVVQRRMRANGDQSSVDRFYGSQP